MAFVALSSDSEDRNSDKAGAICTEKIQLFVIVLRSLHRQFSTPQFVY